MNATRTIHLLILAAEGVTPHKKQPGTEQKINCLPYYKGSGTQPCIYLLNKLIESMKRITHPYATKIDTQFSYNSHVSRHRARVHSEPQSNS